MNTIKVQYLDEPREDGIYRICEFDYLGEHFRDEVSFPSSMKISTPHMIKIPHGEISLDGETVPWVDPTKFPMVNVDKFMFCVIIFKDMKRILAREETRLQYGTQYFITTYVQDLRWGPELEIHEDQFKMCSIDEAFLKRGNANFTSTRVIIPRELYTRTGLWVDSQAEYWGREMVN